MDPEPSSPRWNSAITQGALYLGVDGGGSRCRARIEDEFGTVVSEGGSGPATARLGIDEGGGRSCEVHGRSRAGTVGGAGFRAGARGDRSC